ncbi:MAG TPA: metal ABC transporter permease [Ktedonosporobacter sp.]|nr:metal ABC transporter permease [Ktedonosporobacter sp.]
MLEYLHLELLRQEFVQNAFMAGTIVAIVTAVVGYFVILRAQAFASHSLAHIGFAGATGAALIGASAFLGTFAFTLLAALGMGALGDRVRGRDVEIGMVLSFMLGLGVLFIKLYTHYATQTVNILFGSILSVTHTDVLITLACSIFALLLLLLLFRPLLFASIDPEVAQTRGVPIRFLSIVFLLLLALTITEAVQVVGVLLVFALLIAPAATAERLTSKPSSAIALSVVLGLLFTWAGLFLSIVSRWPVSFYIAAFAGLSYFVAALISRQRRPHREQTRPHPCHECLPVPMHSSSSSAPV